MLSDEKHFRRKKWIAGADSQNLLIQKSNYPWAQKSPRAAGWGDISNLRFQI
jgi:hypothetical protein